VKAKIAVTVDEELLKLAKVQAEKEERTLSNLISIALKKYLEESRS
jgi:metal-responsive CopG/Arc/MetJ family transcriptional regulator